MKSKYRITAFAIATLLVFEIAGDQSCTAEITELEVMKVQCLVWELGSDTPVTFTSFIDLDASDAAVTWGKGFLRTGEDAHPVLIGGVKLAWIPYETFDINPHWLNIDAGSEATNRAYWDDFYEGYEPPESCDYSQNCHGYSFGISNWVAPVFPMTIYEQATGNGDAEIVTLSIDHSLKVSATLCELEKCVEVLPPVFGDISGFDHDCTAAIFTSSAQQYRESGTYTQTGGCGNPIDLLEAFFPQEYSLLKKK